MGKITTAGATVGVAVGEGMAVGTGVSVEVDVAVAVAVGVGVGDGVTVSVAVGVAVGVSVEVDVAVAVGVGVADGVAVSVAVAVGVADGVAVADGVGVAVPVAVGVADGVAVGVMVGVTVAVGVGVGIRGGGGAIIEQPPSPMSNTMININLAYTRYSTGRVPNMAKHGFPNSLARFGTHYCSKRPNFCPTTPQVDQHHGRGILMCITYRFGWTWFEKIFTIDARRKQVYNKQMHGFSTFFPNSPPLGL